MGIHKETLEKRLVHNLKELKPSLDEDAEGKGETENQIEALNDPINRLPKLWKRSRD